MSCFVILVKKFFIQSVTVYLFRTGVKHKTGGRIGLPKSPIRPTGKCKGGHKDWSSLCIFITFTTFPTDTNLPHGHSYCTNVVK